jgi:hypothetical protein
MDLEKLKQDWLTDPTLRHAAFDSVEELAEQLVKTHRRLVGPDAGLVGYLYQQQIRRVKENERK